MHYTPAKNEEVPYAMSKRQFTPRIKNHSRSIGKTAHKQKNKAHRRQVSDHRIYNENEHPPHDQINQDHQPPVFMQVNRTDNNSSDRNRPDNTEKSPAQSPSNGGQKKWGISPGNQHENGSMI